MKKTTAKAKSAKAAKRSSAKPASRGRSASAADQREEASFRETLEANDQLAREPGPLPPGATHQVECDESGKEQVVRKRFSAL
jgi:hypothetical protein